MDVLFQKLAGTDMWEMWRVRMELDLRRKRIVAHDASLLDVVSFFPKSANDWKSLDWGKNGRWRFLADFSKGLEKARDDGKL